MIGRSYAVAYKFLQVFFYQTAFSWVPGALTECVSQQMVKATCWLAVADKGPICMAGVSMGGLMLLFGLSWPFKLKS